MYIDKLNMLAEQQAVTVTARSNVFDNLAPGGIYSGMWLVAQCMESAEATGNATVTIEIQSCSKSDFSSGVKTHYSTPAIAKADLTAGKTIFQVPVDGMVFDRYVSANFTVATGPLTKGKFSVFMTPDVKMG